MMDRGSFNGPGGPHNRWQVPAQYGASMGAEHTLRSKVGMGFIPNANVLRVNRNGLAQIRAGGGGRGRARGQRRAAGRRASRAGVQVFLDGAAPVDKEPACDVNTNPLCDGGGPAGVWTNYTLETVQRIGYGSFEPDNGVLIAKNKAWAAGASRGTEGSQCGYNCFTWVEDAHPEDMNTVDYYKPDGTPIMRTVADYRQLNDALFHAGTNSGSSYEYTDAPNNLKFYVVDKYTDARGMLHYVVGVQNPTGAGPQTRGVSVSTASGRRAAVVHVHGHEHGRGRARRRPRAAPAGRDGVVPQRHLPALGGGLGHRLDGDAAQRAGDGEVRRERVRAGVRRRAARARRRRTRSR